MPKQYNCETCGFSTKYKNRIDYHINKRRSCGIEHINFKREETEKEYDDLPSDDDVLNDLKTMQTELNGLKILLNEKEQTLTQRENEITRRELKLNEIIQNEKNKKPVPVINQTHQRPPTYKFM
jgi:hypothetical protein